MEQLKEDIMNNIQTINGDIFISNCQAIVQQTNCMGVMNAGFAKQIREHYPEVYFEYKKLCYQYSPQELFGSIQTIQCKDSRYIINLFGQLGYGRDKQYTNYEAFENGLNHIVNHCKQFNITLLGFPYKIGCNLGGGNWEIIEELINKTFKKTNIIVNIYKPVN